ncbi:cyanoexosortase A system-associated protein [Pantanalinema rosaneae CENA516]|uniref:cyanoexosortase A system-associated protein n=1 Tax=Pantanalinema rosaneae TaxID=1620701 RepID=UPI003D701EB1
MLKSIAHPLRLTLLAFTLGGTLLVLAKAIATPKSDTVTVDPGRTLAKTVPITGWQLIESTAIEDKNKLEPGESPANGQRYRYRQGNTSIDVDLRHIIGDGNVSRFLFVYSPIREGNAKLSDGIRNQANIGYYGVLTHQGRAYLTACINARGGSTVTDQQFRHNRLKYDVQISRIFPWLWGQEPLMDHRCLWTLMSTPVQSATTSEAVDSQEAYQELETAWASWYQWWQANYPPSSF